MLAARLKGTTEPHGLIRGDLVRGVVVRGRPFAAVAKPSCSDKAQPLARPSAAVSTPREAVRSGLCVIGRVGCAVQRFVQCLDAPHLPVEPAKRGEPVVLNFRCDFFRCEMKS